MKLKDLTYPFHIQYISGDESDEELDIETPTSGVELKDTLDRMKHEQAEEKMAKTATKRKAIDTLCTAGEVKKVKTDDQCKDTDGEDQRSTMSVEGTDAKYTSRIPRNNSRPSSAFSMANGNEWFQPAGCMSIGQFLHYNAAAHPWMQGVMPLMMPSGSSYNPLHPSFAKSLLFTKRSEPV